MDIERLPDPRFWTTDRLIKLLVFAALTAVAAATVVFWQAGQINETRMSDALENRSVSCRILLLLGQTLDPLGPCLEPEVLQYYDPEAITPVIERADG